MSHEDKLNTIIAGSRKVTENGSLVIYNLVSGMDFSNPRKTAEALASVIFEKDLINWFEVEEDHVKFDPKYKVRILMSEEHNKLVGKTVYDFLEDLKKKELEKSFKVEIEDSVSNEEKEQTSKGVNAISAALNKPFLHKEDETEVEDIMFTQIIGYLEIRTPTNEDLINWEKLPI